MAKARDVARLEALTDELEALILKAPQSEFQSGAASTEAVRSLVNRHLFAKGLQRSARREQSNSRVSELIQMACDGGENGAIGSRSMEGMGT